MTDQDELTFASAGVVGVHYARCEPCMLGSHPGGWHSWAGKEDVEHALATGQPDPSTKRCACDCALREPEYGPEPEPDPDESLEIAPCPICGELGACGYDSEGRPLIHSGGDEETTDA